MTSNLSIDPNKSKMRVWRVRVLTGTWLSYAGFYFCRKNYAILKTDLQTIFEIDEFTLAHLFTAYLTAYMLGQFMTGIAGRKFAARTLLLVGMALTLLCNVAFGFETLMGPAGYYPFMIFMVINGFAQATGWPGNVGILGNWLGDKERGGVMALWATSYQVGSMLAKWFAAFMLGWLGASWSFWGASMIMFVVWIVFYFFGQESPDKVGLPVIEDVTDELDKKSDVEQTSKQSDANKKQLINNEPVIQSGIFAGWTRQVVYSVIFIGMTYFVFKFCRYALDSWAPMIISRNFKIEPEYAGYISLMFDLVGFLGVIFAGWFSDKFFGGHRHQIILYMTIGMFIMLFLMVTLGMQSVWVFAPFLALVGFMMMGPDSLLSGVAAIDVGGRRGAILAAGIINGTGSIGPMIQEEAIGWVAHHYSFEASFYLLVACALLGVAGTAFLSYRSRKGLSNL